MDKIPKKQKINFMKFLMNKLDDEDVVRVFNSIDFDKLSVRVNIKSFSSGVESTFLRLLTENFDTFHKFFSPHYLWITLPEQCINKFGKKNIPDYIIKKYDISGIIEKKLTSSSFSETHYAITRALHGDLGILEMSMVEYNKATTNTRVRELMRFCTPLPAHLLKNKLLKEKFQYSMMVLFLARHPACLEYIDTETLDHLEADVFMEAMTGARTVSKTLKNSLAEIKRIVANQEKNKDIASVGVV